MADTKISALSAASALAGTETLPVVQSAATVKATVAQVATAVRATISLTGDVTSSSGVATTIAAGAVTYAKIQNVSATDKLLGRSTAGAGVVEEIACTAAGRTLIAAADAAAERTALGLATVASSGLASDLSGTLGRAQLPMLPPVGITVDGGGSAITTGAKGYVTVPFAATIAGWYITGDQSGSITFDVWKIAAGTALPTVTNTITASAKPLLSSAAAGSSSTLTGWTTSIAAGDIIGFNVDSITTLTKATLVLKLT